MELLFERFFPRRGSARYRPRLPSGDERERVIQYLTGVTDARAAMTANVITYRNRMAAREMGKCLDSTRKR